MLSNMAFTRRLICKIQIYLLASFQCLLIDFDVCLMMVFDLNIVITCIFTNQTLFHSSSTKMLYEICLKMYFLL